MDTAVDAERCGAPPPLCRLRHANSASTRGLHAAQPWQHLCNAGKHGTNRSSTTTHAPSASLDLLGYPRLDLGFNPPNGASAERDLDRELTRLDPQIDRAARKAGTRLDVS